MDAVVLLGEVQELPRLRRAHVRDHQHRSRVAGEQPRHRGGAGEVVATGPEPACTTTGVPAASGTSHTGSSSGSSRWN